jgi:hypothetical protein
VIVVVPADKLALLGVGLLFYGVIDEGQSALSLVLIGFFLKLAYLRGFTRGHSARESRSFSERKRVILSWLTSFCVGHRREAGGGSGAKGAQEVVAVEFEEILVHGTVDSTPSRWACPSWDFCVR